MRLDIDPDIRRAWTPPAEFYRSAAAFDAVREAVFARSWQYVGDVNQLKAPGSAVPTTLLEGLIDEPLLLTRDPDDALHCLSNVCTHRGNLVCEGATVGRSLRCRYHGRRFSLDGKFQFMPEFEGCADFPSARDDLPSVAHGLFGPLFFASLSPFAPLEEWIAPVLERLDWLPLDQFLLDESGVREYRIRAHWALYVDNYLEGFHIPYIHAALNDTLNYEEYETFLYPYCNLQLGVGKGADAVFELPDKSPDFGKNISAYYYWLFPNTMLNFYPWGLSLNVVRPLAPDLTRVTFIPYVWRQDLQEQGAGGDLDRVEREDEAVVELVQRGIRSRLYDRGRYSPKREVGTHHFHLLLDRFLQS